MSTKLSDAQWGALDQIAKFGPVSAEEVAQASNKVGAQRTKLRCHCLTAPTLARLEGDGLVSVRRVDKGRPPNAVGRLGHRRTDLSISITDAGRAALEAA